MYFIFSVKFTYILRFSFKGQKKNVPDKKKNVIFISRSKFKIVGWYGQKKMHPPWFLWWNLKLAAGVAISWSLFQLWYASPLPFILDFGKIIDVPARAIHLAFGLILCFLVYPVVKSKKNLGKGGALKLAVKEAKYDWILTTDIDMSVSLFQLSDWLKKKLINLNDAVYFASRTHEKSIVKKNFFRNILGNIMRFIISTILNIKIRDTQCGFKLYKKKQIIKLNIWYNFNW